MVDSFKALVEFVVTIWEKGGRTLYKYKSHRAG